MKTYKEREVSYTTKDLDFITCDICKSKDSEWTQAIYSDRGNWNDQYTSNDIQVQLKEGWNFPDGGDGIEVNYDICPQCFKDKLIPWLESCGAKAVVEETDW